MPEDWQLWIDQADFDPQKTSVKPADDLSSDEDLASLQAEIASLRAQLLQEQTNDELVTLSDEAVLQSVGIYRYHHPLENAADYKIKLRDLGTQLVELIKASQAIEVSSNFTFENSLVKGAKLSGNLAKLMLRAYNSEADNCIRSLRAGNVHTAKKRLEASRKAIVKLGAIMEMRVSDSYHELRLAEIELTADWLMKKHEEREQQKEERARIREEKRVEKEFAEERERLSKEKLHLENAIAALADRGENDAVRIPGYPPTYSDNIRPLVPGYPPSFDALP